MREKIRQVQGSSSDLHSDDDAEENSNESDNGQGEEDEE